MKNKCILSALGIIIAVFIFLPLYARANSNQLDLTKSQKTALYKLKQYSNNLNIFWNQNKKIPRIFIVDNIKIPGINDDVSLKEKSYAFFENYKDLYLLNNPREELKFKLEQNGSIGGKILRFQQYYKNIPVYGSEFIIHFDKNNNLVSINANFIPHINIAVNPQIAAEQMKDIAKQDLLNNKQIIYYNSQRYSLLEFQQEPKLLIYNIKEENNNILAYQFNINNWVYFINANTGKILKKYDNTKRINLSTYTNEGGINTDDKILWISENTDGHSSYYEHADADSEARNAHNFAIDAYDFFKNDLMPSQSRNSYDNNGGEIKSIVHYGTGNSAWDGIYFKYNEGYANANDIVAHEFTHAVTQYSIFNEDDDPVGFEYFGESGALNESYSDFFASTIDDDDWTIGEDMGSAERDMANPKSVNIFFPDKYNDYINQYDALGLAILTSDPNEWSTGCVHYNCNINNKAFYLMARESSEGMETFNGINVIGIGRDKVAKISYKTLTEALSETTQFYDNFVGMISSCIDLGRDSVSGISTTDCEAVFDAYVAVEIADTALSYNVAFIDADNASGYAPLTVNFNATDSVSLGYDRTITNYSWNFGDGITGSSITASHIYSSLGTYTATLTITDSNGDTASTMQDITVNNPLTPSFTISGDGVTAPATVSFDATATTDATGTITDYSWNFGDGSTSSSGTTATTTHEYTAGGYYNAVLTVTDSNSYTDVYNKSVFIGATGPTYVSGTIYNDTWTAARSPYVINGTLTVASGGTLTIEPGVVVKFYDTTSAITVSGTLNATGTSTDQIVFTSFKDDTYGGDTNGDGSSSTPAPGDWSTIYFNSGSDTSIISNNIIQYGGYVYNSNPYSDFIHYPTIKITGSSPTITDSTIQNSDYDLIDIESGNPTISNNTIAGTNYDFASEEIMFFPIVYNSAISINNGSPNISNNNISSNINNDVGIAINNSATPAITNNNIINNFFPVLFTSLSGSSTISGNTASGNYLNCFYIFGETIGDAILAKDTNFPYVINGLDVPAGTTLTIEPGTVIKFDSAMGSSNLLVSGTLNAVGTEAEPIIFTSTFNDSYGGDTNGDGSTTTPAAGNWAGIWLYGTGNIDYALINYSGTYYGRSLGCGGLNIASDNVSISNSIISDNADHGICVNSGSPVIFNNDIYDNTSYGLYNNTTTTITAENNWWGNATGPYNATSNPSGTGNSVSDYVDFDPWLSASISAPSDVTSLGLRTDVWQRNITLRWINPADTDFASVKIDRFDGTATTTIATGLTASSYLDTSLAYNLPYTYTVYAVDIDGNQSAGATIAKIIQNPAPRAFTATAGNSQISLSWRISSAPAYQVGRYKVYYRIRGAGSYTSLDVGNITSYTIAGLTNGTPYQVYGTTYSTTGVESPRSAVRIVVPRP